MKSPELRRPHVPRFLGVPGFLGFACALSLLWVGSGCNGRPGSQETASVDPAHRVSSPVERLRAPKQGDATRGGFQRVMAPREFSFPEDHGSHPEYQTEWWYLTGTLDSEEASGKEPEFGFQWTLFRHALESTPEPRSSDWATRDVYMGHFAITDIREGRQHAFERHTRGAAGLAGAQVEPFKAWIENWTLETLSGSAVESLAGPESFADPSDEILFPLRLRSSQDGVSLDLVLTPSKPKVLQGDRGFSAKNAMAGGASYYYSYTRLQAKGTIEIEGRRFQVQGGTWFDREWSTSVLAPDQAGWDWFSLQLEPDADSDAADSDAARSDSSNGGYEDGSVGQELMLYQLRLNDGTSDPYSAGVWVDPEGDAEHFSQDQFQIEVLKRWQSPRTGSTYPSGWTLTVPSRNVVLQVEPLIEDQELQVGFKYWEGAVRVRGEADGQPIRGRGYVELVGY